MKSEGLTYVCSAGNSFDAKAAGLHRNTFDAMEYDIIDDDGNVAVGRRYAVIKDANGNDVTDNFTNIKLVEGTLTIKPLTLSIDLGSPRVTYDSETHGGSLTVKYENGPKSGETIEPYYSRENYNGTLTYKYEVSPDADITVTAGNGGPDAGSYTLSCTTEFTAGDSENYKINVTGDELVIEPKTVPVETGSATAVYDPSDPNKPVTNSEATIYNLALNDRDLVTITATGAQVEVGSSENTYSINWGGVNPDNYILVDHLGTLTKTSPVTGFFSFRERLRDMIEDSLGTTTDGNAGNPAGTDSSAVNDSKAGEDSKPDANQSGENTGDNTTSESKVEKNDQTSTDTGKTADSSGESKKDEASSDNKDESGKTESEKHEEAEPEKSESSETEKSDTEEVNKPEEQEPEEQKPEEQEPEEQKPEEQKPEEQEPEEQKSEEQKPEEKEPGE